MPIRKKSLVCVGLLVMLVTVPFMGSTWAQSVSRLELDAGQVPWTHLSFQVKDFLVTVTTDVQLASLPTTEFSRSMIANSEGTPLQLPMPNIYQLAVKTIIDPLFRPPVEITNQVWFNPRDAAAHQRVRLCLGDDDYKKSYRFTREGVYRFRREPKDGKEALLDPEKWTDTRETFYSYDLTQLGCLLATERSILIYIVSATDALKRSEPLSLCVFGKRQLHGVDIRAQGYHPLKVDYLEKRHQAEVRKEGTVNALKISIEPRPTNTDPREPEDFSFLGMINDIVIYMDPTSNLPLQASGVIRKVGHVDLKLREVSLMQRAE